MAEKLVQYEMGADSSDVERALQRVKDASQGLGDAIARDFNRAGDAATRMGREVEGADRNVKTLASTFATGLLRGGAATAIIGIATAFKTVATEVAGFSDAARRAGIELRQFQELRIAASSKGVSTPDFASGVSGLASTLNEARQSENTLTGLLDENNIKYKNRKGEIISTNEALKIAAELIANAATEQDKIEIAKAFSLPESFVPLLEKGVAGLEDAGRKARESGGIIDADLVRKAKEFDDAWNAATASWSAYAKSTIISIGDGLGGLIRQAGNFLSILNKAAGITPLGDGTLAAGLGGRLGPFDPSRFNITPSDGTLTFDQKNAARKQLGVPTIKPTETESLSGNGGGGSGGGGGGKSEEQSAQARLDKYIDSLGRRGAVIQAQIDTFGQSNAIQKAAEEIARASVDLNRLDAETRQTVIDRLTDQVKKNEALTATYDLLKAAQKGARDAADFFGQSISTALEDLTLNGKKGIDIANQLGRALASAAIQSVIIGKGPLAGIFGFAGTDGKPGGIFGAIGNLFATRAGGGYLPQGMTMVGENGPEWLFNSGNGASRVYASGTGPSGGGAYAPVFNIDARGADVGAVQRLEGVVARMTRDFAANVSATNRTSSVRGYPG